MTTTITTFTRPLAVAAAAGMLLFAAACSSTEPADSSPPPPVSPSSAAPTETSTSPSASATPSSTPSASASAPAAEGNQALLAAGATAEQEVADHTVISIESERDGWEVHLVNDAGDEQQLRTDAAGGSVTSGPTDDRPDADDRTENEQFAGVDVSYRDAVEAIEAEVQDGRVTELSLDREGNRILWEADVTAGNEQRTVQIDAGSGDVVSNELDD